MKRFDLFALILIAVIALSCAGQVQPSGGPIDTVPPEIVETIPPAGALRISNPVIRLRFSKYVNRRSVEDAMFISPSPGPPGFEWGGTELEIRLADSLRPNTTYILTLGTDVVDMRNGNHMAKAFALPFSTGDHIDSASIAGRVYDANPQGVMVVAYRLDAIVPDTLDPTHTKPDFLTQTGKDGSFLLPFLPPGTFRIFALRDEFKNLTYDIQTDKFGVLPYDVTVTAGRKDVSGLQFLLSGEDTTAPFLSSARALDRHRVLLRFSEPMDSRTLTLDSLGIADTLSGVPLKILNGSFVDTSGLEAQLVTAVQDSAKGYRLVVGGLLDRHANSMKPDQRSVLFIGRSDPDTARLHVSISPEHDSVRNIPPDVRIALTFSKPVDRRSVDGGLSFVDSSRAEIATEHRWMGSSLLTLVPALPLNFGKWYRCSLRLDSVRDGSEHGYHDTSVVRSFRIIETSLLGSIEGTVGDGANATEGEIRLNLRSIGAGEAKVHEEVVHAPGPFQFLHLEEGRYTLFAFRDVNGDGRFSSGLVYPYHPSERFVVYPDTLKVRARWPLEGVQVKFGR